jgi:hypothetical protein
MVFGATVLLSWATTSGVRAVPFGSLLIGTERAGSASAPSSRSGRSAEFGWALGRPAFRRADPVVRNLDPLDANSDVADL